MNKVIASYRKQFEYYKSLADKTVAQLSADQLIIVHGDGGNSIAVIMKHIAGNLQSRWTDIFTTDGEKNWRNRDAEFELGDMSMPDLMQYWEESWQVLFDTLESISDADLNKIIYIRNMGHTVQEAIVRQVSHYPYHVGQIVFGGKGLLGEEFKNLSIAKGASATYNSDKFAKEKSIKHFTEDL